jgi:hypothetical protein
MKFTVSTSWDYPSKPYDLGQLSIFVYADGPTLALIETSITSLLKEYCDADNQQEVPKRS